MDGDNDLPGVKLEDGQGFHDIQHYLASFNKELGSNDPDEYDGQTQGSDIIIPDAMFALQPMSQQSATSTTQNSANNMVFNQNVGGSRANNTILVNSSPTTVFSAQPKPEDKSVPLSQLQFRSNTFMMNNTSGAAVMMNQPAGSAIIMKQPAASALIVKNTSGSRLMMNNASRSAVMLNQPSGATIMLNQASGAAFMMKQPSSSAVTLNQPSGSAAMINQPSGAAVMLNQASSSAVMLNQPSSSVVMMNRASSSAETDLSKTDEQEEAGNLDEGILLGDPDSDPYQTVTIVPTSQINASGQLQYVLLVSHPDQTTEAEGKSDQDLSVYDFKEEKGVEGSSEVKASPALSRVVIGSSAIASAVPQQHLMCNYCNYTSPKKYLLTRHLKTHSEERPHRCSHCDRCFKTLNALQNHTNTHIGARPHRCKECDATFTTSGELVRHTRYRHTFEKPHKCAQCNYASVELSKLKRHMRSHSGERPYQCPHCSYASPDTYKLKRHLRIHTGEKPYPCDYCGARFTQSNSLKAHRLIHTGEKPVYQCELCPTTCGRKTDLKMHVLKLHTSQHPITCRKCGKSFPDRYTYKVHVETHRGEKCYQCELCPYKAHSQRLLETHIFTHTGEKPFTCEECDQTFRQKQLLKRHMNLYHTPGYQPPPPKTKAFGCQECGKQFAHQGNLLRHLYMHDPTNPLYQDMTFKMEEDEEEEEEEEEEGGMEVQLLGEEMEVAAEEQEIEQEVTQEPDQQQASEQQPAAQSMVKNARTITSHTGEEIYIQIHETDASSDGQKNEEEFTGLEGITIVNDASLPNTTANVMSTSTSGLNKNSQGHVLRVKVHNLSGEAMPMSDTNTLHDNKLTDITVYPKPEDSTQMINPAQMHMAPNSLRNSTNS